MERPLRQLGGNCCSLQGNKQACSIAGPKPSQARSCTLHQQALIRRQPVSGADCEMPSSRSRGVVVLGAPVGQRLPAALAVVRHAAHNQHIAVGQGDNTCRHHSALTRWWRVHAGFVAPQVPQAAGVAYAVPAPCCTHDTAPCCIQCTKNSRHGVTWPLASTQPCTRTWIPAGGGHAVGGHLSRVAVVPACSGQVLVVAMPAKDEQVVVPGGHLACRVVCRRGELREMYVIARLWRSTARLNQLPHAAARCLLQAHHADAKAARGTAACPAASIAAETL